MGTSRPFSLVPDAIKHKHTHASPKTNWFPINAHLLRQQMNISMTCDIVDLLFDC